MYVNPQMHQMKADDCAAIEIEFSGSVNEIIGQMKAATGATTDDELALLLEMPERAIGQWKKRQSVPEKAKLKIRRLALARDHSRHSDTSLQQQMREQRHAAFAAAVARLKARTDER